ncbi:hypothetical protein WJX73_008921 [Symbiochloris irregularis]|uniref:Phytocyanin domain-containing protein n=1 Tax=Symbiochloris irregularis TaxID=706552 RepID=A0AAW1PC78_9CHLO
MSVVVASSGSEVTNVTEAETLTVGNSSGWALGVDYQPLTLAVGGSLQFAWERGQHNVVQIDSASCNALAHGNVLAGLAQTSYSYIATTPGSQYFACSVPGHCSAGMLLRVNVTGNSAVAPAPAFAPSSAQPQNETSAPASALDQELLAAGFLPATSNADIPGYCKDPVPDPEYPGYTRVTCYGPGIDVAPGQVVNWFYELPSPFVDGDLAAVAKQTSQLVDETGRPVPLSEIYVHHFFGAASLINAEGAELRGTMTNPLLPQPHNTIGNGSVLNTTDIRTVNVHLINTLGVLEDDLVPCIECWCRDKLTVEMGYRGGTACCSSLNCPTTADNSSGHTYFLQYNMTYKPLTPALESSSLQYHLLDVVNGSVEHDILAELPGASVNVTAVGILDSRCPQKQPYGIAQCIAHQHIGGQCIELRFENGTTICKSCPVYGSSPSVDTAGNEHSYLVKMEHDTLQPVYMMEPGSIVELVSQYDASTNHYGVMSLFTLLLDQSWDPSCPGAQTDLAFGPRIGEDAGDAFGFYEGQGSSVLQDLGRRQVLALAGLQLAVWQPAGQVLAQDLDLADRSGTPGSSEAELPAAAPASARKAKRVRMETLSDSALSVAIYPEFKYNASGGGGVADLIPSSNPNRVNVKFDPKAMTIPDVTAATATWLGMPMLPGARIAITPSKFEGFIDKATGQVEMTFVAEFNFNFANNLYKAPPLLVTTNLTTEEINGSIRQGHGQRMNDKGVARLVGVAQVPKTTDTFINKFLMLPTETFAAMSSKFEFL